ncbi:MAG: hypothetical protein HPY64_02920 [Anaerolineae bacterium]|nr:hypothetical protein [Anaerolineae bacterium]
MDISHARDRIREFITLTLIGDPDYPLADDELLVGSGLLDDAAREELAGFLAETFGIALEDDDLSTENIDTVEALVTLLRDHLV